MPYKYCSAIHRNLFGLDAVWGRKWINLTAMVNYKHNSSSASSLLNGWTGKGWKRGKMIEKFSLGAGFAGKTSVLLHGRVSLGKQLLGSRNSQAAPGSFAFLWCQDGNCGVHSPAAFTGDTGEDEHNIPGRKANTLSRFTRDTIIPTEEL